MFKLCFMALFFITIYADVVYLKNGRSLEGDVFDKSNSIILKIPTGQVEIKKSEIRKIKYGKSAMDLFVERQQELSAEDSNGWFDLYLWAKKNKFPQEDLLLILDKTIQADPGHEKAQEIILDLLTEDERKEQAREEEKERKRLIEAKKRKEEKIKKEKIKKIREKKRKENEEKEKIEFGLLPFEIRYNIKEFIEFENFIDDIYQKQQYFPVDKFANRGGLNLLFSFIFAKARKAYFSANESRELANKYKNVAAVGGDRAFDVFHRTFFTILRLDRQKNPKLARSGTNRFQDIRNKRLVLFALRFATKVASGGRRADGDFNSSYSFLFFKFNKNIFLALPEKTSYRLAAKCAAIIAAGGGDIRFRRAFGFHLRQFRREKGSLRKAIFPAIKEALREIQHPRRFFKKKANR